MPSITHQVARCLDQVTLTKEEIEEYKVEHDTDSVKKDLRPGGDPTKLLPNILGIGTAKTYFRSGKVFFERAKELSGENMLGMLLTRDVIMDTFDAYYASAASGTASKIQAAIKNIFAGAVLLGWVHGKCPIDNDLRERNSDHVLKHRYGYFPEDAIRIIEYLSVHSRAFCLPAEIALKCGLRENEISGLKVSDVHCQEKFLLFKGKGGKSRPVPIPTSLLEKLSLIRTPNYYFTPSESWCANFRNTVQKACMAVGIDGSGVHRLRATYAQLQYTKLRMAGMNDRQARLAVSKLLGHNRIDVTYAYIPREFNWEEYVPFVEQEADEDQRMDLSKERQI